ncbi:MAG: alpha/beta hydrolase [Planctomycetota bacterium]|jgi:acetyl esterase|nr:lipase [Deltaproteobacteria bacterium]MDP6540871.1 alpha/beta hydrolase [Planctomycetota bacterium]
MADAPGDLLTQLFTQKMPETVQDMREMLDGFAGLMNADLPEVGAFHPRVSAGDFTADVIVPKGEGPFPVLVYLHGGGWICGSPTTHTKLAHRFAEAGHLVFNVDYRMAPEHPFPTPFDDCLAAVRWAAKEAGSYGGDAARLAVGGDSAGGNLTAAVTAALAEDPVGPKVGAALLIYGVFDFAQMGGAMPPGMDAGPLAEAGGKLIDLMVGSYLGSDPGDDVMRDPRVSPIHVASKLPPTHVVCGTADPLVEQARALRSALEAAGIPHEYAEDEDMPHGYAQMEFLPASRPAIDRMIAFLERTL